MSNPSDLPRLYDEKEVTRLLKRATEIQREEPVRAAGHGGLSLDELADIAAEACIDPRHIRRAVLELHSGVGEPTLGSRFTGEQTTLAQEMVLPGELPTSGFERMVSVIQRVAREHGHPSLLGRSLTWQGETANKTRSLQVVVSVRRGETQIRVEERLQQLAGAVFGISMGAVGGSVGMGVAIPVALEVLGSGTLALAFPLGWLALTYLGAREIFRRLVARRRTVLAELMDQLSREAAACISEGSLDESDGPLELPRG